jgi:hypothetical protein
MLSSIAYSIDRSMLVMVAQQQSEKVRENRARRTADRQGLRLVKSRRRDPRSIDYGAYMLVDRFTDTVVAGELNTPRALSLEDVERYLTHGGGNG